MSDAPSSLQRAPQQCGICGAFIKPENDGRCGKCGSDWDNGSAAAAPVPAPPAEPRPPREPTRLMLDAGRKVNFYAEGYDRQRAIVADIWRAMYDAAPAAEPVAQQPPGEVVVTKDERGRILAVTRQDDEGRILSVIAKAPPVAQQPPPPACETDPRAPHGFLRNESHSEGRYVCECEDWEPPAAQPEAPTLADELYRRVPSDPIAPWFDRAKKAEAELAASRERERAAYERADAVRKLVDSQAEDEGLWFVAATAPEAYLQRALRDLHATVECALATPDSAASPTGGERMSASSLAGRLVGLLRVAGEAKELARKVGGESDTRRYELERAVDEQLDGVARAFAVAIPKVDRLHSIARSHVKSADSAAEQGETK